MASATVTTYASPIKFNIEIVAGGIIAGVILGLVNKFIGSNHILQFLIGALLFFFGPTTAYGSFFKIAGLAMMGEVAYAVLKQNVVITSA
jgi:F0F1-type ATP synthase assembly protein I